MSVVSTVAKTVAVPAAISVVSVVRISLSISVSVSGGFRLPLAEVGDSSERVSGKAGGVVVAGEARVDVVVVAQNEAVRVVGGVGAPLAVVEPVAEAETLGRPVSVGSGVASMVGQAVAEAMAVAVVGISISISISAPLATCSIDGALEAQTNSGRPCR